MLVGLSSRRSSSSFTLRGRLVDLAKQFQPRSGWIVVGNYFRGCDSNSVPEMVVGNVLSYLVFP